jgi:hypothetical protein
MERCPSAPGLSRWERAGLFLLLAAMVAFGVVVELRTAFLKRRMGDLGVYLRAAWAVRVGGEFYDVTDDNGWHYSYPPVLAIALAPLADAPAGADRTGMLPYAASAAIWYILNLLCLALAVHWLASALEKTAAAGPLKNSPPGCRTWWLLRVLPVLVCLPMVAHTLMRGQVNLILLTLLCGMAAGLLHGRRFRAGVYLAGMICIKVFPAYLLLYPLWRRDGRCLAGCAAGLFVGLLAIPLAVFGPVRTVEHYQKWAKVLLGPALGAQTDTSREKELTAVVATDTQAFHAVLHNTLHPDRWTRPIHPAPWVRAAGWLIGAVLTGLTLLVAWRRRGDGVEAVLLLGALATIMLLLCPVCHLHNLVLAVLLVMALVAARWQRGGDVRLGWGLTSLLGVYVGLNVVPQLPGLELTRDFGLAMYAALLLWLAAVVQLGRRPAAPPALAGLPETVPARAA